MLGWTEDSFPPNWEELRDRWHRLHLLRFVLSAVGTSALLAGLLADTPTSSRASGRRKQVYYSKRKSGKMSTRRLVPSSSAHSSL